MGSTSEETMDYTMVATTATTSFTTSYANGYGTSGSCPSSSSPQASPFRPYFPVSGSDDHLRTTSSYSGTIMSSTTTDSTPYEPLVVRPMHKDSGYTESGSHPHPHHHSPHHPHHPHHHRHRVSPYPTSPYDRPQEEVDTKPSLPSPRCPLGPSPLPPMSPSAKSPDQPEKTVNYEELRMKIAYKKFERDCIMEFDGDTVLCRVCGDKASGFHYGVHACEGCKGFFRRSIQQKIQYRPCLKNQQCNIMRVNRNRCQYCRLKKCIAVGMSRDAVRFGRVPKKEKAKILEQMAKVNQQSQLALLSAVLDQEPPRQFVQKIVEAHLAIAPYTFAKFAAFYKQTWAEPSYVDCPAHMACPLKPAVQDDDGVGKWEDFTDSFTPAIRNVVSFAKQIPGFTVFNQEDQVTLLKAGTFEVLLLHLACLFDTKSNTMMFTNGKLFKRSSSSSSSSGPVSPLGAAPGSSGAGAGAGFLLDSMFDFAERLVELKLSDEEMALFCAMVIIAPDRPGLRNAENIERVQTRISSGLHSIMAHRRSSPSSPEAGDSGAYASLLAMIPDLRTLNQLHSEKLGNLTVPDRPVGGTVPEGGMIVEKFEKLEKCPFPEANVGGLSGMSGMSGVSMSGMSSPHMLPPAPAPTAPAPSTATTSEAVVLQTSMGTFHRYSMSPPPAHPRTLSTASSRSSPDPLEMDMHPSPPPLLPVGRETAEGVAANPPPTTHPHHHPHKPPALESLQADMHSKMAQLYNLWEFDMRSNRSNSLSSTSSTESGGSVDSAYRSAPATPPRHPGDTPATSANSASVLKQALSMPPLVAQHTWFHHPPGPQSSAPRTSSSQDLHRSVLELSRRAAHEAMKSGPAPAGPYNPVAAAAAAAMMYQQQQQYAAAAAMQHYMHAATAMPQHHSAAQAQRQHSVPPPPSSAPFLPLESGGPLNLSTPKTAAPLSPSMPKVKVEPL